jgi:hypothetical protein
MRRDRRTVLGLVAVAALLGALAPTTWASPSGTAVRTYAAPASLAGAGAAGEPSLGVNWKTGAVLFRANEQTYRVTFDSKHRAHWALANDDGLNLDPILYTDSALGRTWTGGLLGACARVSISDDDRTWVPAANPCAAIDHETIGAGPWVKGLVPEGLVYPHAVYYCAHAVEDMCTVSHDGGLTFGPQVPVGAQCQGGHGHVKVSADGSAYLPSARCGALGTLPLMGSTPGGAVSRDSGKTWTSYVIGEQVASTGFGFDPSVATTPDNTVYEAWIGAKGQPMVARSGDHGATWKQVTDLSRRGAPIKAVFPAMVAGRNGRVAVAYLGSRTRGEATTSPKWEGVWDLYISYSLDAGRTWSTTKVTKDPVQRGYVCTSGTTCASHRNLLDFMDAQVTKDGRVVVAYADGCTNVCATEDGEAKQSTGALASLAVQWGGPQL